MNGVPEYYELKMKQTSKGIWYCDGFTAVKNDLDEAVDAADEAMHKIEEILEKHNKEAVASTDKQ